MIARIYQTGFSLIELMVTMAIIGVLSAIAIPAYNSYVTYTRGVECENEVAAIRLGLEEFFLTNSAYIGGDIDGTTGTTTLEDNLGAFYNASNTARGATTLCTYNVALRLINQGYTITATGVNDLAGVGTIVTHTGP